MNNVVKKIMTLVLSFTSAIAFAQEEVPMADTMRSEGKIYVVVGILVLILLGLLGYVFLTDRKITKLEEKITSKKRLKT